MQRNPNSWRLLALFFAAALLFCLGSIQGNPVHAPDNGIEYISDQSPPTVQQLIVIQAVTVDYQIAREVSVPILYLTVTTFDVVGTANHSEKTYYINFEKTDQFDTGALTNTYRQAIVQNTIPKEKPMNNFIYGYRAREKI